MQELLAFAREMEQSGIADAIRSEKGNLRYQYFVPLDDLETVLLIDSLVDQAAIDEHHESRISDLMADYVYMVGPANSLRFGKLILKKNKLLFVTNKGKETAYDISAITDIVISSGCLQFIYAGNTKWSVSYAGSL